MQPMTPLQPATPPALTLLPLVGILDAKIKGRGAKAEPSFCFLAVLGDPLFQ